jgi:hypothetical protein
MAARCSSCRCQHPNCEVTLRIDRVAPGTCMNADQHVQGADRGRCRIAADISSRLHLLTSSTFVFARLSRGLSCSRLSTIWLHLCNPDPAEGSFSTAHGRHPGLVRPAARSTHIRTSVIMIASSRCPAAGGDWHPQHAAPLAAQVQEEL